MDLGRIARARLLLTRGLVLAGLALWPIAAPAQVNVEKDRARPDEPGFAFKVELRFGLKQGNVNLIDGGLRARGAYRHGRHLVFLLGDSRFAAQSTARARGTIQDLRDRDTRFINRHMAHLRYNLELLGWLVGEAFVQGQTDEFLLVNSRVLLGTGPRFVVLETDDFGAYLGTAYMAEHEGLDDERLLSQPGGEGAENWWHRWSNYVSVQLSANDRVNMRNVVYIQPRFDEFGDFRVLNEAQLEVSLTQRLSLKLIASIAHDSRPPTYCAMPLEAMATCPDGEIVRLQQTDVALQNSFTLEF